MILGVSLFLLFAVLVPGVGHKVNGSQRWIGAGLLQFQPSELAKLALVLYGALLLSKEPKRARTLGGLGPYLLIVGLALLLIAKEPDLGTTIVASVAVCCVLFLGGVRRRTLAPVGDRHRRDRHRDDRHPPLPGGPPHGLPPSQQRHGRRRIPGQAGDDRDRLRRDLRRRPRRERAEGLLPARGPHRHDRGGDRRGAGHGRHGGPVRPVRDVRLRGAAGRAPRPRPVQQAARGRTHLADHGPGGPQPVRGARARATHRSTAAIRLLWRDEPGDDARGGRADPERRAAARSSERFGTERLRPGPGRRTPRGRGPCETSRGRGRNP